jgi:hypothetical protein
VTGGILLAGDPILREPVVADETPGAARMVVWACDLAGIGDRRIARVRMKAAAHAAYDACRTCPRARHLVLVYQVDPAAVPAVHRLASAVAARLHAELEQRAGRDVDVVFVDITGVEDPGSLWERLEELSRQPAGLVGAAALTWRDVRSESIRRTASRDYI